MSSTIHPVDEKLPNGKLAALGLQHVLVMYAGAVAVPLIVGRALKLSPQDVAYLISADLFCCGLVTLIQSLGATQLFGIKLPVMMGVTFASVAPMVAMANANPGEIGAQLIFGAIIGAGLISILIAPLVSRMLRFFPPVVTGTIIAVIGISLMRVGVGWAMGGPAPLAQSVWLLEADTVAPTLWRYLSITEVAASGDADGVQYEVTGLRHLPGKWDAIERNQPLSTRPTRRLTDAAPPVASSVQRASRTLTSPVSISSAVTPRTWPLASRIRSSAIHSTKKLVLAATFCWYSVCNMA